MFKDYYAILEISFPSDEKQIKAAYRQQSLKWHPDRNIGRNTEEEMKAINEAYAILSRPDSKQRYDIEYIRFRQQTTEKQRPAYKQYQEQSYDSHSDDKQWEYAYDVKDENLKNDINNARRTAEEYVKAFMSSLKADVKSAAKGAWDGAMPYIISALIMPIFILLFQTCS